MNKKIKAALRHPNSRFDEPNWAVYARNKTEARKLIRKAWREENGYKGINFDEFKIEWKEQG
jgi:hypothetical protein